MSDQSISLQKLHQNFGESIIESHSRLGQDTAVLRRSALLEAARMLKDDKVLDYDFLMDATAVDHLKRRPRFEVVYHFYSLRHNHRLRIKVPVGEDKPEVPTLSELWPSANWYEREVFDMFGIRFEGHPDLRRILMYEGFEGHALRKDYPFDKRQPLVGQSE